MTIRQFAIGLLVVTTTCLVILTLFYLLPKEVSEYLIGKKLIILEINL